MAHYIKKIKAPIGDENCFQSLSKHSFIAFIKKIKAPIGDENSSPVSSSVSSTG